VALPPNISTVTVTATYVHTDGTPASGTVTFTPTGDTWLADATGPAVVLPTTVTATLDASGTMSVVLPATDDPDVAPTGYTYDVVETFGALTRSYSIALPSSPATIDLAAIAPIAPAPGSGANVVTQVNGHAPDNTGAVTLTAADIGALRRDAHGNLTAAAENMPRWAATDSSGIDMQSGATRFAYVTAQANMTITRLAISSGDIAAGATPDLVRYGLYSVDASGGLTQLATTVSDTSALSVARQSYPLSLQTPVAITDGQLYAIAAIVHTAATAPTVMGVRCATAADTALSPRLTAFYQGGADLESSYLQSNLTDTPSVMYAVALP
jgi:hypothetical protein